jgi:hypothetical protein
MNSLDTASSKVTGYGLLNRGLIPDRGMDFFSPPRISDPFGWRGSLGGSVKLTICIHLVTRLTILYYTPLHVLMRWCLSTGMFFVYYYTCILITGQQTCEYNL